MKVARPQHAFRAFGAPWIGPDGVRYRIIETAPDCRGLLMTEDRLSRCRWFLYVTEAEA